MSWDMQNESQEYKKRRVALIRKNFSHPEINAIFLAEKYETFDWKIIQQRQLDLEKAKEQFEQQKSDALKEIQETKQKAEDELAQVIQETELRQKLFDSSGLNLVARKIQFITETVEKQGLENETIIVFLYLEDGQWKSHNATYPVKSEIAIKKLNEVLSND
jgi:hypothetical protein